MNLRLKNTKRLDQGCPKFLWQQATPLIAYGSRTARGLAVYPGA